MCNNIEQQTHDWCRHHTRSTDKAAWFLYASSAALRWHDAVSACGRHSIESKEPALALEWKCYRRDDGRIWPAAPLGALDCMYSSSERKAFLTGVCNKRWRWEALLQLSGVAAGGAARAVSWIHRRGGGAEASAAGIPPQEGVSWQGRAGGGPALDPRSWDQPRPQAPCMHERPRRQLHPACTWLC